MRKGGIAAAVRQNPRLQTRFPLLIAMLQMIFGCESPNPTTKLGRKHPTDLQWPHLPAVGRNAHEVQVQEQHMEQRKLGSALREWAHSVQIS